MTEIDQRFQRDLEEYRRLQTGMFPVTEEQRVLYDDNASAGISDPHYFYQDLWAASKIYCHDPERHVDIGSRLDGFIAHLLVFTSVEVVDIRPLELRIPWLTFHQEDATELAGFADNSVKSLSCLHALEHFGLGRYGDPIDPDAWHKALRAMARVLAPGGRLYLSVPVGRERVIFNAHRVFSPATMAIDAALKGLKLHSFSLVDDQGRFHEDVKPEMGCGLEYGCGMFEFRKSDYLAKVDAMLAATGTAENNSPLEQEGKFKVLCDVAERCGARALVEVGTYKGDMARRCADVFCRVWTTEMDPSLAQEAKQSLVHWPNITAYGSDGRKWLPKMFSQDEKLSDVLVYLDGHYSGPGTARGDVPEPAVQELDILLPFTDRIAAIVVDDFRCFGVEPGFPSRAELLEHARQFESRGFTCTVEHDQVLIQRVDRPNPVAIESTDQDCDPAWKAHSDDMLSRIATEGPENFMSWYSVKRTMLDRDETETRKELEYIEKRCVEGDLRLLEELHGLKPPPCPFFPSSSSNQIHHAYHVARFEDVTTTLVAEYPDVLEFGGGYGSMCRLLRRLGHRGRYQVFDLPGPAALQRYYLGQLGWSFESVTDLDALKPTDPGGLFIATWSLSEVPIAFRRRLLEKVRGFSGFLIAYQRQFKNLDNLESFAEWRAAFPDVEWFDLPIPHSPGNRHLFGRGRVS